MDKNRPFLGYHVSLFHNKFLYETFQMKMRLIICMKMKLLVDTFSYGLNGFAQHSF